MIQLATLLQRSTATLDAAPLALASAQGVAAPEWVQIFPVGPDLPAGDGRAWRLDDPAAVIAASRLPVALDYDHAMDRSGVAQMPASGWVEELAMRDGAVWGRVVWTSRAAQALAGREWRFFSPAFDFDPKTLRVTRLVGGALVNRPAFRQLPALASETHEDRSMKAIFAALGLPEAATEAEVVAAVAALKDVGARALAAAQTPPLEKFAPRADYDAAVARATAAEAQLAAQARAAHEASVAAAIEGAVKGGKVAPASVDYYRATCATAEGLAAFEKFVAGQPSIFATTGLDKRDPERPDETRALTADQSAVARAMGLDEAAFAKHLAAQTA